MQSFDRRRMVVGGKNEINNDAIALLKMRLPCSLTFSHAYERINFDSHVGTCAAKATSGEPAGCLYKPLAGAARWFVRDRAAWRGGRGFGIQVVER